MLYYIRYSVAYKQVRETDLLDMKQKDLSEQASDTIIGNNAFIGTELCLLGALKN